VQGICDRSKRFLWCYASNKGSTHDSAAFTASRLYDLLKEVSKSLNDRGLFLVGDSAYGLASFLLTPYEVDDLKDDPYQARDGFNYNLSCCRIYIECAFGELVMRWGIFWRTLLFGLKKSARIVEVCMLLHNYIIDSREANDRHDQDFFQSFSIPMDNLQQKLSEQTGEVPRAIVSDNNEPRVGGRKSNKDQALRDAGETIRHQLTLKLSCHEMRRPMQHNMQYNSYGHIFMTS
jgi:DDE superfamily endonuclease